MNNTEKQQKTKGSRGETDGVNLEKYCEKEWNALFPFKYMAMGTFDKDGITYAKNDSGLYGYIDRENHTVIPFKFKWARDFNGKYAKVSMGWNKTGVIDKEGNVVVPLRFHNVFIFGDDFVMVEKEDTESCSSLWGLFDLKNGYTLPCIYNSIITRGRDNEGILECECQEEMYSEPVIVKVNSRKRNMEIITDEFGVTYSADGEILIQCDNKELKQYEIKRGCEEILPNAFLACSELESVIIPDTVDVIGESAFMDCVGLSSIVIPANVKAIGNEAFYRCSNLHEIKMPEFRPQIGHNAFWGCPGHAGYPFPKTADLTNKKFTDLFKNQKPLIGMIHTNHTHNGSVLELAKKEIEIYLKYGIYPLIENYFGSVRDCEEVLAWMYETHANAIYGVNILGNFQEAFRLAKHYGASFIQIDSVCGHLSPAEDEAYAKQLSLLRQETDVVLLGGVRFKYQPVRSGRSLEEDLLLGMERCDAIVCTGEGTGQPTPFGKVEEFKAIVKDFPVIVGAGVTLNSAKETFRLGDGAIVGSWFKEEHQDTGDVREEYVEQMVEALSLGDKTGFIPPFVKIKKEDIILWFSKWAALHLDYHAVNEKQCEVTFLSRNHHNAASWLPPGEKIIVQLESIMGSRITLDIKLTTRQRDLLLFFMPLLFPFSLFHALSYVGKASTGGEWKGQGTYVLIFEDRLSYPYEAKLRKIRPGEIHFEGDDVVVFPR